MRTFTSNLVILSAKAIETNITGTAIDGDILLDFTVKKNDINAVTFIPEANLVVTGDLKLGEEPGTIIAWISSLIAVVSLPVSQSPIQKRAASLTAKKIRS
jgi:hypothetical protein